MYINKIKINTDNKGSDQTVCVRRLSLCHAEMPSCIFCSVQAHCYGPFSNVKLSVHFSVHFVQCQFYASLSTQNLENDFKQINAFNRIHLFHVINENINLINIMLKKIKMGEI